MTARRRVGPGSGPQAASGALRPCSDGLAGHPLGRVVVFVRHGNYSAFNGYRFTPSDYSAVRCQACGSTWRTSAAYADDLPYVRNPWDDPWDA